MLCSLTCWEATMASQPVLSLDSFVSLSHVWFTALISYSDIKCKIVFSFPFSFLLSGVQKSGFFLQWRCSLILSSQILITIILMKNLPQDVNQQWHIFWSLNERNELHIFVQLLSVLETFFHPEANWSKDVILVF